MGRFERRADESRADWLKRLEAVDRATLSSGEEVDYNLALADARDAADRPPEREPGP